MSAFSCTGPQLANGVIAQLPAGAFTLEYKLAGTQVDPGSPNFQWPVDPGLTAVVTNASGATVTTVVLKTAQRRVAFSTGAANPPGSTFNVAFSTPNAGNIAELEIGWATLSGDAPPVSHT